METWRSYYAKIRECLVGEDGMPLEQDERRGRMEDFIAENGNLSNHSSRILRVLASRIVNTGSSIFNNGINGSISFFIDPHAQKQQLRFAPRTYRAPESHLALLGGVKQVVIKDRGKQLPRETLDQRVKPYQDIISRI
jgi:hypothetical protein